MIQNLIAGLAYLHYQNIVHRDIKPENLLVKKKGNQIICLKIADFGLAQIIKGPLYIVCGTPTYVAPEILAEVGYGVKVRVNYYKNLVMLKIIFFNIAIYHISKTFYYGSLN